MWILIQENTFLIQIFVCGSLFIFLIFQNHLFKSMKVLIVIIASCLSFQFDQTVKGCIDIWMTILDSPKVNGKKDKFLFRLEFSFEYLVYAPTC